MSDLELLETLRDLSATAYGLDLDATAESLALAHERIMSGTMSHAEALAIIDGARFVLVPEREGVAAIIASRRRERRLRWLHIAAFMVLAALVLVGGAIVLMNLVAGARLGIGSELFIGVVWGWMMSGLAMAYWQERISR